MQHQVASCTRTFKCPAKLCRNDIFWLWLMQAFFLARFDATMSIGQCCISVPRLATNGYIKVPTHHYVQMSTTQLLKATSALGASQHLIYFFAQCHCSVGENVCSPLATNGHIALSPAVTLREGPCQSPKTACFNERACCFTILHFLTRSLAWASKGDLIPCTHFAPPHHRGFMIACWKSIQYASPGDTGPINLASVSAAPVSLQHISIKLRKAGLRYHLKVGGTGQKNCKLYGHRKPLLVEMDETFIHDPPWVLVHNRRRVSHKVPVKK